MAHIIHFQNIIFQLGWCIRLYGPNKMRDVHRAWLRHSNRHSKPNERRRKILLVLLKWEEWRAERRRDAEILCLLLRLNAILRDAMLLDWMCIARDKRIKWNDTHTHTPILNRFVNVLFFLFVLCCRKTMQQYVRLCVRLCVRVCVCGAGK